MTPSVHFNRESSSGSTAGVLIPEGCTYLLVNNYWESSCLPINNYWGLIISGEIKLIIYD